MKKTQIIALVSLLGSGCYAQLSKGAFMLGTSVNYQQNSNSSNDSLFGFNTYTNKYSNLYINLNFGYFITDHVVIGITGNYQNNFSKYNSNDEPPNTYSQESNQTSNSFSGGLFMRYYKMIEKSKFGFFGHLATTYGLGNSTRQDFSLNNGVINNNVDSHGTSTLFNVGLNPGIVFFITNKIGIEASIGSLGYSVEDGKNFSEYNQTGTNKTNDFYANFSMSSLYIGLNFYFGGTKVESKEIPK